MTYGVAAGAQGNVGGRNGRILKAGVRAMHPADTPALCITAELVASGVAAVAGAGVCDLHVAHDGGVGLARVPHPQVCRTEEGEAGFKDHTAATKFGWCMPQRRADDVQMLWVNQAAQCHL